MKWRFKLLMESSPSISAGDTHVHDIPDVILANIFAAISDTRSRNASSLVCRKWKLLERISRASLTLRGNARNLCSFMFNTSCFQFVTNLDISLLSPWGQEFSSSIAAGGGFSDPSLLPHLFRKAFPRVTSFTIYSRSPQTLECIAPHFPHLVAVKLVRWHHRCPLLPPGADFFPLFEHCLSLASLDLSDFYHWTEDLPAALDAHPTLAFGLTSLNLMTRSLQQGFRTNELRIITSRCPNLVQFRVACTFDPRLADSIGDDALKIISFNCPKLALLHLSDASTLTNRRSEHDGSDLDEAGFGLATLIDLFSSLPLLEDLCLDVCRNVTHSGVALDTLVTKCPRLKNLKLGQFQTICLAMGSQLDGIALCAGLQSLSVKNCNDLTDMGLIAIARGCSLLAKFEVEGCKNISINGIRTMASLLKKTLVDVRIARCKLLGAESSLRAIEPIQNRIQRIHIDCVWNNDELEDGSRREKKKCKYGGSSLSKSKYWDDLRYLSLWVPVGEVLTPLAMAGLEDCPRLEEVCIKVEGDSRDRGQPSENAFGLSNLARYPEMKRLKMDCGCVEGNVLTAPSGQRDLSFWERFYLLGIDDLSGLEEIDYWIPQDSDLNLRALSQPAASLLAQCYSLRRLFIHGTAHEHFMSFLLKDEITNLRDVQLRGDYYPAPDNNEMSTEMRVDSCSRFEAALNMRLIQD